MNSAARFVSERDGLFLGMRVLVVAGSVGGFVFFFSSFRFGEVWALLLVLAVC